MEMNQFLQSINTPDPEKMIENLQSFFKKINAVRIDEAFDLVSLYSTVDVLRVNGLNKESVTIIKMAIKARMISIYRQYPAGVKSAANSLGILIASDESLRGVEKHSADLL